MPSQEEYLDQLLRNIMNGGKGQPSEEAEPVVEEAAAETERAAEEIYADETAGEMQWAADMVQTVPEMPAAEEQSAGPDMGDLPAFMDGTQGAPEGMYGVFEGMPATEGMPGEMSGLSERMPGEIPGMFEEESVVEEMSAGPDMGDLSAFMGMQGVTEGTSGMLEEMPMVEGTPEEMSGIFEEMSVVEEMSAEPDMSDLSMFTDGMPGSSEAMPGMLEEMPVTEGTPEEMSGMFEEMSAVEEMPAEPGMSDLSAFLEELQGMPDGIQSAGEIPGEMPATEEVPIESDMGELSALMEEIQGSVENNEDTAEVSVDDDIAELFKTFEDEPDIPVDNKEYTETFSEALSSDLSEVMSEEEEKEAVADSPTTADISSMSEDDIERLLAESSGTSGDSSGSLEEAFQGDVADLLKGTEDGELQEIQDLLEKSDNNEAVDDEIETILKEAAQESYQNSTGSRRSGTDADHEEGAEEQLSTGQKKAMEKKRLKEEKAAAKRAAKEARKAEKAAKKAARKGENAAGAEAADGAAAGAEQSVDTAFLDSILSEAGKIDGAETISSATGNYDVKVDNIIPDEGEDASSVQKGTAGADFSTNADLGVDLDNLFSGSAEAESAMMAGGDSDLAGFVALDGKEVNGIIELGGGDEEETKPKKKGFFSRFLEFLTEEEEEEEENENIRLSEENQEIIEDLDKEKAQKDKKGKKGKKKAKKADESSEGGEEGEEGEDSKKDKKKKARKPKKEKLPEEEEPVDPGKKLKLKKVLPIALICLSLGAAIIIMVYGSVNFSDRKNARNAYYEGDYQTCYQNLYGKDMNESEQVMFGKSECILRIRMWIREYEILNAEGAGLEALDSLIQSVNDYPALYDYAGQCNAAGEVAQEYATILNLLYENYGLTEDQARTIAAEPDDIEYTRQVNAIVQGGAYGSWNEPEPEVDAPLQDELPEETELPEGNFIDTNAIAR